MWLTPDGSSKQQGQMMKKLIIGATVLLLVLVAGVLLWLGRDNSGGGRAVAEGDATEAVGAPGGAVASGVAPGFVTGLEGLPKSLQGTEVDGSFEVDANGHLKITNGIRHIFDYFLSTVGEEPVETIVARIKAYIHHQLKEPAASEAEHILDGYIAYKKALSGMPQPAPAAQAGGGIDIAAAEQQMEQVQALRSQYLSPEVIQAFFGDEDTYNNYTLARLRIFQNKSLSDSQRAQQLAALQAQLPQSLQDAMKTASMVQDLQQLTDDWKKRGGTPDELHQIRENLVGPEATTRLEQLDKDNSAWDARMNSWFSQRDAILGNPGLSDQDKQAQLDSLRSSLFSATEQVRVAALERIHDGKAQ
jgi:lipase chaperone LimK